jgi:hypothetical protein
MSTSNNAALFGNSNLLDNLAQKTDLLDLHAQNTDLLGNGTDWLGNNPPFGNNHRVAQDANTNLMGMGVTNSFGTRPPKNSTQSALPNSLASPSANTKDKQIPSISKECNRI